MTDQTEKTDQEVEGTEVARLTSGEVDTLTSEVIVALKEVYDPEIPVDIYELGLIYHLDVQEDASAFIQMTLTSPACPVAGSLPGDVERKVRGVDGIRDVSVELVWDPPWDMDKMSEGAKLELGML